MSQLASNKYVAIYSNVVDVVPIAPLAIQVRFEDGMVGKVRFEHSHLTGVFAVLKDPAIFRLAHSDCGAVTWPGDLDLAPDAMYSEIKAHGEWVLR